MCVYACVHHAQESKQGKLKLTILQTLHVGGVFRELNLHHARDVREGAGRGSLSWHHMWVLSIEQAIERSLGVAQKQQSSYMKTDGG